MRTYSAAVTVAVLGLGVWAYGWIEPGPLLAGGTTASISEVNRFWENRHALSRRA